MQPLLGVVPIIIVLFLLARVIQSVAIVIHMCLEGFQERLIVFPAFQLNESFVQNGLKRQLTVLLVETVLVSIVDYFANERVF